MSSTQKKALNKQEQAGQKFALATNKTHEVAVPLLQPPYELTIDFQINPDLVENADDEFTLFSTDTGKTYSRTLMVKDDCVKGDQQVTLKFTDLNPDLSYSLEIYPGYGAPKYLLFAEVPYADLKMAETDEGYLNTEETEKPEEEYDEKAENKADDKLDNFEPEDQEIDSVYQELLSEEKLDQI